MGVHPHDAKNCSLSVIENLVSLSKHPKAPAWGEIGLDFNRMYSPKADQEKWFQKQLEIAAQLDLPMIFHERDSNGRFLEILKNHFKKVKPDLERYLRMPPLAQLNWIWPDTRSFQRLRGNKC